MKPTLDQAVIAVKHAVADIFLVTEEELTAPRKTTRVSRARQAAMMVARDLSEASAVSVGLAFGRRGAGSGLYAIAEAERRCHGNPIYRGRVEVMRAKAEAILALSQ
jgi:chromosomal replication initiation ATPase DnaA